MKLMPARMNPMAITVIISSNENPRLLAEFIKFQFGQRGLTVVDPAESVSNIRGKELHSFAVRNRAAREESSVIVHRRNGFEWRQSTRVQGGVVGLLSLGMVTDVTDCGSHRQE